MLKLVACGTLPNQRIDVASSQLGTRLSLPASGQLAMVAYNTTDTTTRLIDGEGIEVLFFVVFMVRRGNSEITDELVVADAATPVTRSDLIVRAGRNTTQSSSYLVHNAEAWQLTDTVAAVVVAEVTLDGGD